MRLLEREDFAKRLTELRQKKGVSARDMSLSLGQSPGYINNIENGINFPSMTVFFYICDYFDISPKEFFDLDIEYPDQIKKLIQTVNRLSTEKIEALIKLL